MDREKCPICGRGIIEKYVDDMIFSYKGHDLVIKVVVYRCNHCKEEYIDDEMDKYVEKIKEFQRMVDNFVSKKNFLEDIKCQQTK